MTPYEYALKWIRNQPIGRPFELWELYAAVRICGPFANEDWRQAIRVALSNSRRAGIVVANGPEVGAVEAELAF